VLIAIGVATTLWLLRNREPEVRVLGVLCAVLVCTSGFGPQYLLWVLPLMLALSGPVRVGYVLAAAGWAAIFHLSPMVTPAANTYTLRGVSWLPAALLLAVVIQLVRDRIGLRAEPPARRVRQRLVPVDPPTQPVDPPNGVMPGRSERRPFRSLPG